MKQRGRPSLSSVAGTGVDPDKVVALRSELPMWPSLNKVEQRIWTDVVRQMPAGWFSPADAPLLAAYCRAVAQYERVSVLAATAEPTTLNASDAEVVNPIFRVQDLAVNQMAKLAVKLRISQSSRLTAGVAGTKVNDNNRKATGARPWDK